MPEIVHTREFVRLFVQHQQEIYRYILTLHPDHNAAQDILQETAMAIWEKFDTYRAGEPFVPWALKFAYHKTLNHRRNQSRQPRGFDDKVIESIAAEYPAERGLLDQQIRSLEMCVAKLDADDRRLIEWRYGRDATLTDLATAMNCSRNVLYKALARIRSALVTCVERQLRRLDHG